jgi:hypothetical protein
MHYKHIGQRFIIYFFPVLVLVGVLTVNHYAFGQTEAINAQLEQGNDVTGAAAGYGNQPTGDGQNPTGEGQNPGQTGQTQTSGLTNPLKEATIEGFLISIIDVLLVFAVPVIIYFIMYGGFKLVTARGDTSQIEEGRNAITWAVVGGVIVLGAKLIITVIRGTISAFGA